MFGANSNATQGTDEMTIWKAALVWLLVVVMLIGAQLGNTFCSSSDGARLFSLLVGYVVVSLTMFALGYMVLQGEK